MKIAFFQKESFIDYPNKISTVIFVQGCNYNCGYCHNPELKKLEKNGIDNKEIFDYLDKLKGKKWVEAVVISGGEPTEQVGLRDFSRKIKDLGYLVKVDTNGRNYEILRELKIENLVDYVAIDVKGPLYLYPNIIGREFIDERDDIGKGIAITSQFPDYEFRTTLAPVYKGYEGETPKWMTPEDIRETARLISEWADKYSKYFLQPFKAIEKEGGDSRYLKKNLPKEMWETPRELLEKCLIEARKFLPNSEIR